MSLVTYNHAPFVAQAIESILSQEVEFPCEVVIGEDDSSDGTRDIVHSYAQRYPEVIRPLFSEGNLGRLTGNGRLNLLRNLAACRGEYIALLEGDDYWTDDLKLARQVGVLEENVGASLCLHPTMAVHRDHPELSWVIPSWPGPCTVRLEQLLRENCVATSSVIFRASCLPVPLPNWFLAAPVADWPLFVMLAQRGSVEMLGTTMSVYRLHPQGLWWSRGPVEQRQALLPLLDTMSTLVPPDLRRVVAATRLQYLTWLSRHYCSQGDVTRVRELAWRAVTGPFLATPSWDLLRLFVLAYGPHPRSWFRKATRA